MATLNDGEVSREREPYPASQTILDCVGRGLDILGESAKASTIYFVEVRGGVKFNQISNKPDEFVNSLRAIFGLGSLELLKSILKELRLEEARSRDDGPLRDFAEAVERGLVSVESGVM